MQFETAEVLAIADIGKDTLRHWKKVLPRLRRFDGRSTRYSLADLIVICIISRATRELGVAISQFAKCSDGLFEEAANRLRPGRLGGVVTLLPDNSAIWTDEIVGDFELATIIRIDPIIERIKIAPQGDYQPEVQLDLPFEGAKIVGMPSSVDLGRRSRTGSHS